MVRAIMVRGYDVTFQNNQRLLQLPSFNRMRVLLFIFLSQMAKRNHNEPGSIEFLLAV